MKEKNMIGFVILHYLTINDTINCVNSIKKSLSKNFNNYHITIVDNNSNNNTGKTLNSIYKEDEKINVIINDKNLGFAKGNNIGYKFLKDNYDCNYIILTNNDIIFKTRNIDKLIIESFNEYKYSLLGPCIYNIDGSLSNVGTGIVGSIKQIRSDIIKLYLAKLINDFHLLSIIKRFQKTSSIKNNTYNNKKLKENIMLHGCCLFFSPIYIKKFDGIDDRTFLYREEDILYIRLQKNHMKSIYYPKIEVIHIGGSSTNNQNKTNYKKQKNKYKNLIKSSKILYSELKEKSKLS